MADLLVFDEPMALAIGEEKNDKDAIQDAVS